MRFLVPISFLLPKGCPFFLGHDLCYCRKLVIRAARGEYHHRGLLEILEGS